VNILQAIILGIVQGLTEFLPVSSSAHLSIASRLMNLGDTGAAFTAIVQFGTQFAVVLYFRHEIVRILRDWFKSIPILARRLRRTSGQDTAITRISKDAKMGWLVILGTLPIVFFGVLFKHYIETSLRNPHIIATTLIIFGVVLWVSDHFSAQKYALEDMKTRPAFLNGVAQSLALIPGVSRSGATISAARLLGFERKAAAQFSFYLSIPSVFGAGIFELRGVFANYSDATSHGFPGWFATVTATIIAFAVGYLVIALFMKLIARISFKPFAIYRIIVALFIFALF
jgi:undecaprenyl-diphosphatase